MAKVQVDVEGGVKKHMGRALIGPESDPRRGKTRLRGAELIAGRDALTFVHTAAKLLCNNRISVEVCEQEGNNSSQHSIIHPYFKLTF